MSLKPTKIQSVPKQTARVAKATFPKGNHYMVMRDQIGVFFNDLQFAELYPNDGQPAFSPWRLALLTIFQFSENLTDRQAADALRSRIDWKYALSLELEDPGFDFSVLSKFRSRLISQEKQALLFDTIVKRFLELGLIVEGQNQRTDSTHILSSVRELNRLESLGESLRNALNALSVVVPKWIQTHIPDEWFLRYERHFEQYRMPKKQKDKDALALQIGKDGHALLTLVYDEKNYPWLKEIPAVDFLRRKWIQQFHHDSQGGVSLRKAEELPPARLLLLSPHEPDARIGVKRELQWHGYKLHETETCTPNAPKLLTNVRTTVATTQDVEMTSVIHEDLAKKGLLPKDHFVDEGYTSAQLLVESQEKYKLNLMGPIPAEKSWQARIEGGFGLSEFEINWSKREVICPEGQRSKSWSEEKTKYEKPVIRVSFDNKECLSCEKRGKCTKSKKGARRLSLRPEEEYLAQQARRGEQEEKEFWENYRVRSGVEGVHSQGVRRMGMRQSRYRGIEKTNLQHLATAAAINITRAVDWIRGLLPAGTRTSSFRRLAPA